MTKTTYKTTAITTATKNFNDPVDDDDEVISRISRAGRRALPQLMALVPIYWTAAVRRQSVPRTVPGSGLSRPAHGSALFARWRLGYLPLSLPGDGKNPGGPGG